MKAHIRIILLISMLAVFVWIAFLSSAQQLPTTVSSTNKDLPLFLNGKPVGSVENTQPLEDHLQSLKGKLDNFNAAGESLPNIGRLAFFADKELSAAQLGQLWSRLGDYFGYPRSASMALVTGVPCERTGKVEPTLIVSNSPLTTDELEKVKKNGCWFGTDVITAGGSAGYSTRLLKSYRTAVTSLEITDTGSYLLNEQAKDARLRASPIANLDHPTLRRKVDTAPLVQRPIDPASQQREIDSWIQRRRAEGPIDTMAEDEQSVQLPVILARSASFDSLLQILKSVGNENVTLKIIVNNTAANIPKSK